jgi:predicted restriction endonuclease
MNGAGRFVALRHPELLDAAHIIPDAHPSGQPVVPNGLSICRIHHGAYDNNLIGIRPDFVVEVPHDVLRERDGPMLRHGIQELADERITIPRQVLAQPLSLLFPRSVPARTRGGKTRTISQSAMVVLGQIVA